MRRTNRAAALLLAALLALSCVGCMASTEQLYALPQLSDEYVQLETLIADRIRSGGEYAAPTEGTNRQTVQLRDLDGNGEPEAIAFLADGSHTPSVCVYRRDDEGSYYLFVAIEGVGSAVGSVEYADLTGDGGMELILTWQLGGDIGLLSVYSLRAEEQTQLLSADCAAFLAADLDGDGVSELFGVEPDRDGGAVTRYDFSGGGCEESEAPLSDGVEDLLRLRTGVLSDGTAAVFAESRWGEDGLITDVFTLRDGSLRNITLGGGGRSPTLRQANAFAEDVNGDRALEIPDSENGVLFWYGLDADGDRIPAFATYHDYENGWYLILPEDLAAAGLTVFRSNAVAGESAVTFTADGGRTPLVAIFTLTGENREDRAREAGRFVLDRDGSTVYAAELLGPGLTEDEITESFHRIHPNWQSGVI